MRAAYEKQGLEFNALVKAHAMHRTSAPAPSETRPADDGDGKWQGID